MELLFVSFLAGVLTILAPCVVSVVIAGLGASIIVFTVLLKATSLLLGVPADVWKVISGGIVVLFGVFTLFPGLWEWISLKTKK